MPPPIFNQRLPEYDQRQKGRQHRRCEHHLDDCETDGVFAKKPTCNNARNSAGRVRQYFPPTAISFHALYLSVAMSTRDAISLLVGE